ncbi:MAG: hypothetical protein QM785_10850 [Pyrinomonadaceae bacterium]
MHTNILIILAGVLILSGSVFAEPQIGDTATHERKPRVVRTQNSGVSAQYNPKEVGIDRIRRVRTRNRGTVTNAARIKPKKPLNFDPISWVWDKNSNRMVRRNSRPAKPKR